MIEMLVKIVIVLVAFGVLCWAIINHLVLAQPWKGLIIVLVALIAFLLILGLAGVVTAGVVAV